MNATYWFLIVGALLIGVAVTPPLLRAIPISTSIIYLCVGLLLGPNVIGLLSLDIVREAHLFERLTEIAVLVSLFTVGLNMRRSPTDTAWLLPVRLASLTMVLTIAAVAVVGVVLLNLPIGAAILLGAVLAPTDPVLASDVQIHSPTDRDTLRYGLSGEAGLNDGTAFPFVMLGLGLLGLHPDDTAGLFKLWADGNFTILAWLGWDVAWAVSSGLAVGALAGWLIGRVVLNLQQRHKEAFGLDEFLVLGLIALAYGLAELVYGYGFLSVFAAGYALRYLELKLTNHAPEPAELPPMAFNEQEMKNQIVADKPEKAAQFLALSLQKFNEQLERILQATIVLLIGGVFTSDYWTADVLWFAPLLFLIIRPLSVMLGLIGSGVAPVQRRLMSWFGIRGIGSLYYLTYAISHGLPDDLGRRMTALVLSIITVSIVVHGISVSPLMNWYERTNEGRQAKQPTPSTTNAES